WGPADFGPGNEKLLIANYVSISDSRAHLIDLGSGENRRLAGGGEEGGLHLPLEFDAQAEGFYLLTDRDSEFTRLAHMVFGSGAVTFITGDIAWDVESFDLSDDGARAAFEVNEDGISRLYLMDPKTREYRRVELLPTGLVSGMTFSPDGRRLAMTLETARTPSDVFTLELGDDPLTATGLTRWTHSEVGGLDTEAFVEPELVHFPGFDGREIPAFLMKPKGE
ncbi:MAG: S9 family peptidase, partial [Acidobacteria bacterium]|nr:S9 family peptidase [Acidobacteriota bacterium]NIT12264.1 S9 family peptidase [Acidobacteriota bacterium]